MARALKQKKSATITDIAKEMGVSSTTVWRAVSDHPEVSKKTRDRIMEAVKRQGYRPSIAAQSLVKQRTSLLGVMVPMLGGTAYSAMVRSIEQAACEYDYNIILCETDLRIEREKHYIDMLIGRRVEGVIAIPFAYRGKQEFGHFNDLEEAGIPVVYMDHRPSMPDVCSVASDRFEGGRIMTNYLLSLGHQRIAFMHIGLSECESVAPLIRKGYDSALADAAIAVDESLIVQVSAPSVEEDSHLLERVEEFLKRPNLPSAIFAYTDMLAIKTMQAAIRMGIRVPEDLAIVGFDDILVSRYIPTPLTTMRQPTGEVGHRAAELLFERIKHPGRFAGTSGVKEYLPCELIVRESCGAFRRK